MTPQRESVRLLANIAKTIFKIPCQANLLAAERAKKTARSDAPECAVLCCGDLLRQSFMSLHPG
jgi:hypothetical protein